MYSRKRLYNSHIWTVSTSSTTMFFRPISSLLWPSSLFRNVHILANRLTTSIQNTDTFMFLTSPFFSRAVGISEILEGTYYRWLNPRKFLLFSKNVPKHYLEHFPQWEDAKDSYLAHFFEDREKLSVIKPPLISGLLNERFASNKAKNLEGGGCWQGMR